MPRTSDEQHYTQPSSQQQSQPRAARIQRAAPSHAKDAPARQPRASQRHASPVPERVERASGDRSSDDRTSGDRTTPQSLEAEQSTLGAMLMEREAIARAKEILCATDFYRELHRKIWAAIVEIDAASLPVDLITVTEELRRRGQLEEIGGTAYLSALIYACPTAANVVAYATTVLETSLDRQRLIILDKALSQAYNCVGAKQAAATALESLSKIHETAVAKSSSGILSAAELCAREMPEPKWAIDGLIPEGLTILAGKPKMGKSWLSLAFALATATGGRALGTIPVEQGPALYLGLEDTPRRMKSRLLTLSAGLPVPDALSLGLDWPRLHEGGLERIEAWLRQNPTARLVVVDTLEKARPPREKGGNSYAEDYAAVGGLQKLASKYGVAIIAVHHTTKQEFDDSLAEVSGTMGITGSADGVLVLKRKRNQGGATLFTTGRDVDERELALNFLPDIGTWTLLGDASDVGRSAQREAIIEVLLEADQPLPPRDIAEMLSERPGNIRRLLFTMKRDGEVEEAGAGEYRVSQRILKEIENVKTASNAVTPVTVTPEAAHEADIFEDEPRETVPIWPDSTVLSPSEALPVTALPHNSSFIGRLAQKHQEIHSGVRNWPAGRVALLREHANSMGKTPEQAAAFFEAWSERYDMPPSPSDMTVYFPIWEQTGDFISR